jgi:hypothetical protein
VSRFKDKLKEKTNGGGGVNYNKIMIQKILLKKHDINVATKVRPEPLHSAGLHPQVKLVSDFAPVLDEKNPNSTPFIGVDQ